MITAGDDLWVFGYGSLMWRPGFAHVEATPAHLVGFQRSFCIYSTHHRGSPDRPGLVLGLDRGGACTGLAFRVPAPIRRQTIDYLREREQVNGVYQESWVPVWLESRNDYVLALAYVVERAHPSYAGRLPFLKQVSLIRAARGLSGANVDYLVNTSRHLTELGLRDRQLERLATAIGGLFMNHAPKDAADNVASSRSRALVACCRQHPPGAPLMPAYQRRRFMHRIGLDRLKG